LIISLFLKIEFSTTLPTLLFLSICNLYFVHKSIEKINLNDLNPQRAFYILKEYLNTHKIEDPEIINTKEKLIFNKLKNLRFCNYPLEKIIKKEKDDEYIDALFKLFKNHKFFVYVEKNKKFSIFNRGNRNNYKVYTFLRLDADNGDILMAFLYSVKVLNELNENNILNLEKAYNTFSFNNYNLITAFKIILKY